MSLMSEASENEPDQIQSITEEFTLPTQKGAEPIVTNQKATTSKGASSIGMMQTTHSPRDQFPSLPQPDTLPQLSSATSFQRVDFPPLRSKQSAANKSTAPDTFTSSQPSQITCAQRSQSTKKMSRFVTLEDGLKVAE